MADRSPWQSRRALAAAITATIVLLVSRLGRVESYAQQTQAGTLRHSEMRCLVCHTDDAPALARDPAAAREALAPDLEDRCNACHADEGPSHKTGVAPHGAVPAALPLAADGTISCATCHFVHDEPSPGECFTRIDNSRGALCLTCHTMAELE